MKSVVIYDEFVMPTKIRDVTKIFSSRAMVDKQKEGCEVQKQYEKYGPTTTICNKVEKNFHEKDENPFLFVLDLEIDQKHPKNQATSVDLGKLRKELSTATAQLQPEGKKEKDLNKDKEEVGALNKDATSSPPLEKEQDEMTTDKERDRAFNRDVISSRSFEKKEEDLNADKIGPKASDEVAMSSPSFEKKEEDLNADNIGPKELDEVADKIGPKPWDEVAMSSPTFEKKEEDLNADKTGPKASDEVAMSSPNVLEREEENLNTSKKSFKANENKFKDEKIERERADGDPRQDLSPIMILVQFFERIVSSNIGKVLLLLCFASLVIGKSEGNQEPNCDPPKEPISKLFFLKPNETCTSLNVNLQCANGLIAVCLPVVPGSDQAVGCAQDRPINGKGCPEWNNDNGCYVLNVRHNECETCSDYYLLSNSSEVAKCFKDKRATTTEQITVTSAKGTPDEGTSLDHGDETTAASPNKTSKKSEGNNK